MIKIVPAGWVGPSEVLRMMMLEAGLGLPHHHNAWGELTKAAVNAGLIKPTGQTANMKLKKSHARKTPVYRRGG